MSMTWKGCLALAAVGALFIGMVACGGQEAPPPPPTTTTTEAPAPAAEEPGEMTEATFGVAECDNFIKSYTACLEEKVPEEARTAMMESLEKSKEAWTQAAATEEGKAGLAAACTEAETAAKEAVKSFGCEW
jgi:hypothetical protein